jgi:outer membrane usher protein
MWNATNVLHLPVFVVLILSAVPLQLHGSETAILNVVLNEQDLGDYFLITTESGDALFTLDALQNFGFRNLPLTTEVEVEGKHYVPMSSLAPGVTFRIDETSARIHINADPELLEVSEIDLTPNRPHDVVPSRNNSGFVNYGLFYELTDDLTFKSLSAPAEAGLSVGGRLLFSSFSYTRNDTRKKLVRLMSNFTVDNTSEQRQFIVGDFSAFSGDLGSGGIFGGLSIAKNFAITPRFVRSPELSLSGTVETPSELEIFVDNRLVETRRVAPGGFDVLNIPNSGGSGEVTLVVRDAFGRERIHEYPFYSSTALLKAGLHEYSYNLGFRRQDFGFESSNYGDLAFLGFHRLGITDNLTVGLSGEASSDMQNLGAGITFASDGFGEMSISVAGSLDGASEGYAGRLRYDYRGSNISRHFAITGFSEDYATLNHSPASDKPRFAGIIGLGYRPFLSGSVSIQYSATDYYLGQDLKRLSLSYTTRIFSSVSVFVRASRMETSDVSDEIVAGFTVPIGLGSSAGMNYISQEERRMATAYMSKNPPSDVGSGYRFQVDTLDDPVVGTAVNGNAMFQHRGSRGVLSAEYRHANDLNSYRFGLSGATALINRSLYLSRPILDSFALVKTANIEGVSVRQSNQVIGVTNENGEVLAPNLISYYDNHLSINDIGIPVNYAISEIAQRVVTPLRGGVVVDFGVSKIQAIVGRLFVLTKGTRIAAEYWGLELNLPDGKTETIVGRNAKFYLENVPAGEWPARLFLQNRECLFSMAIPQSEEMIVEMGEVTCEIG